MATENNKSMVREYLEAIIVAVLLALFIRAFIVQAFKIPSGSMLPTLLIGDHILVNKFVYGIKNPFTGENWVDIGDPQRRDIVVFKYPEDPSKDFIKRVIAIAGDRVEIKDKKVYINDKLFAVTGTQNLSRDIIDGRRSPRDNYGPVTVPPNSLFVMGDNRDNSHDSRFWGFVDLKDIKGEAFIIYWSWNREEFSPRWGRMGDILH